MALTRRIMATTAVAALALTGCGQQKPAAGGEGEETSWPTGSFTLMVPGDAGGGWDGTGRALTQAMETSGLVQDTQVINQGGAAGTIGLASFVENSRENSLSISGSTMIGGILLTDSAVTLDDVQPAAVLISEPVVLAVRADSPYKSLDDFLSALKKDTKGTSVAVGSTGGVDHLGFAQVAEAAGVDPTKLNAVSFKDGGLTSVLNGDVAAGFSTLQQWRPQIENGDLRVLGVTSAERVEGLDAPTFMEQGIDVEWATWHGLVAPKDTTKEEAAAIADFLAEVQATDAWQEAVEKNDWTDEFMVGEEADEYFEEQRALYEDLLPRLGLTG
ncbi:tripartite tricarboxylate transporter substrate binding protein [Arthrobacter pigmenti]